MSELDTRVIQVTNVAPTTTKEQLKTLFQFIGRIRELKLFPPEGSSQQVAAKVCYVEFEDTAAAGVALHLTNTVFIDRALIVVPVMEGKIPDERVAMQLTPQTVARINPGQPSWPTNVVSQLTGTGSDQVITTYDPQLNALGLPQYPPLPPTLDADKVEEIRRTVYIGNLDPQTTPKSLISFFSQAGEVKYVRMAGEDTSIARAAYLELTDQRSVINYLGYNGTLLNGRPITVSHAMSSINKPLTTSQEASRREVEEAMKKVQEAQALISAAAAEKTRSRSRSRKRSRSHSRSRTRRWSRSRSRGRRRRSRSRSRRKSRSPRRARRSRSRSPRRRRSRSRSGFVVIPARERRRSRSNSRSKRRSRSRSKRRSRTPPRSYSARRSRSRSKGSRRKSRSRTPRRSRSRSRGKGKDRKDKVKESEKKKKKDKKASKSRSLSPPTLKREGSTLPHSGDDRSPARLDRSTKEETGKQSETETQTVSEAANHKKSSVKKSEAATDKKPSEKKRDRSESPAAGRRGKSASRSPVRGSRRRSVSRSPVKTSRRRSISPRKRRSKSRSPRRSRSPAKKKKARSPRRSRSGSRHRSKKDKKKERSRSRERKEKKKKSKDKRENKEKEKASSSSTKMVARDYDEEEKGFNSASDPEEEMKSQRGDLEDDRRSSGADQQPVDMDTSD